MIFNTPDKPQKLPLPLGISTPSNTWFLGPPMSASQKYGWSNLDIVPSLKHPWSVARSHCKWQRRQLLKMDRFSTLKGSWRWPWPWIGSYCIPSCITHRPLSTCQMSLKSKKLCGQRDVRTYGQTDGRTFETGFIRSTPSLCRRVDLKARYRMVKWWSRVLTGTLVTGNNSTKFYKTNKSSL